MRRRRKNITFGTATILFILSGSILSLSIYSISKILIYIERINIYLLFLIFILSGITLILFIYFFLRHIQNKRYQNITLSEVDQMTGIEFEDFLKNLFERQGFSVQKTVTSGDLGVDLVISKDGIRTAIQAKRYKGLVGRSAVSDVVAGMAQYKCQNCQVITNSYFTSFAKQLAYANNCKLIDRTTLSSLLLVFKKSTS